MQLEFDMLFCWVSLSLRLFGETYAICDCFTLHCINMQFLALQLKIYIYSKCVEVPPQYCITLAQMSDRLLTCRDLFNRPETCVENGSHCCWLCTPFSDISVCKKEKLFPTQTHRQAGSIVRARCIAEGHSLKCNHLKSNIKKSATVKSAQELVRPVCLSDLLQAAAVHSIIYVKEMLTPFSMLEYSQIHTHMSRLARGRIHCLICKCVHAWDSSSKICQKVHLCFLPSSKTHLYHLFNFWFSVQSVVLAF